MLFDRSPKFANTELTESGGPNRMTSDVLSLNLRQFCDVKDLMSERQDLSMNNLEDGSSGEDLLSSTTTLLFS